MTTPTGTIAMTDIQTEFGGANPISLSEYYAGGAYVASSVTGVPSSLTISMDNLRSKTKENYGTLTPSITSVPEGASVTFTLSGGDIGSGTLYWKLTGTDIDTNDFTATSGSFTVTNNAGSFTVYATSDANIEGVQTFRANVGIASGVPVTYLSSVDVSLTETKTYTMAQSATSVNEGGTVTFSVNTGNVPIGTVLYYSISDVATSDFTDDSIYGSVAVSALGGIGLTSPGISFSKTLKNDSLTEGGESFTARVHTGSSTGTLVVSSSSVTIADTSKSPPTYSLSWSPTSINEGGISTATLTTTNVSSGTTLYRTLSSFEASNADLIGTPSSAASTSVDVIGRDYFFAFAAFDSSVEGSERLNLSYRLSSDTSTAAIADATLTINQMMGTVGTLSLTKVGGEVAGGAVVLSLQITSIASYAADRLFRVWYELDLSNAWTDLEINLTVLAFATSSALVDVYTQPTAVYGSHTARYGVTCVGHTDKHSNSLVTHL